MRYLDTRRAQINANSAEMRCRRRFSGDNSQSKDIVVYINVVVVAVQEITIGFALLIGQTYIIEW